MLTYQKNKLANLILQFEISFNQSLINDAERFKAMSKNDALTEIRKYHNNDIKKIDTIKRNIQSIKKQIDKL